LDFRDGCSFQLGAVLPVKLFILILGLGARVVAQPLEIPAHRMSAVPLPALVMKFERGLAQIELIAL